MDRNQKPTEKQIKQIEEAAKNRNTPCEECEQCGAKYYSDKTARQLEKLINTAKQLMQEISVINYTKIA